MAADFDAGSIEGTLELDTTPFRAGLDMAKSKADEFGDRKIEPSVGLDKTDFDREKDETEIGLDKLGAKKAKPKVELQGWGKVLTEVEMLKAEMGSIGGGIGETFSSIGGIAKIGGIVAGITGLVAAALPAGAALLGFGSAAALAFGGAAGALGLFALALKSTLGPILAANKAGTTLTGVAGRVQKSLAVMTTAWGKLTKAVQPQMLRFLNTTFEGLAGILPMLTPLLRTTTEGMTGLVKQVLAIGKTKTFSEFLGNLQGFMKGFLNGAGPVIRKLLLTFMNLFIAFNPLMKQLGHGVEDVANGLLKWSRGLKKGQIDGFIAYIERYLPLLKKLGKDTWDALTKLFSDLKPLSKPALNLLDSIMKTIKNTNFKPIIKDLGQLFNFVSQHLPMILKLSAGLLAASKLAGPLKTLVTVLGGLSDPAGWVVLALVGLAAGLVAAYKESPAFRAEVAKLAKVIQTQVLPVLSQMWHWFVKSLQPAIKQLAQTMTKQIIPALLNLWTAIKPLIPIIEKLVGWVLVHLLPALLKLWGFVMSDLIGAITDFIRIMVDTYNTISKFVGWVKSGVQDAYNFFAGLGKKIEDLTQDMISAGEKFFGGVFTGIKNIGAQIITWAKGLPAAVLSAMGNIGGDVINKLKSSLPSFVTKHLPHIATGGVTNGPMRAVVGDNPGGREAIIPLDKYDLPRKGSTARVQQAAQQTADLTNRLLKALVDKTATAADLAEASKTLSDAQLRRMVQIGRAAA